MLAKRIIPCLDVLNGVVVKGVNFKYLRYAGDPVRLAQIYEEQGADEIVFLDIGASPEGRKTMVDVVKQTAENLSIPFTVGGGVRSLADMETLLRAGADKVSINTAAVRNPENVRLGAERFGSQCVVVAIDAETVWDYKVSNDAVAKAVSQYPDRLIGFASVDPHKGVVAVKELERAVKKLGLKGLKLLPHLIELYPNDKRMYPVYEKAQELGIPVLFHTGTQFHTGTRIKYCKPIYLDDVAVDFPDLKIVIAHFGFPWFYEAIAVCQRNPNVYFNIAGWAPRHIPEPVIRYMNGPLKHKCLFGSDYPLLPRKRIIEELKQLPLKQEVLKKLFEENPKRLLGID